MQRLIKKVRCIFPDANIINEQIIISKPNMMDIGILVDLNTCTFKLIQMKGHLFIIDEFLLSLFNGYIHIDKAIVFEFEYQFSKRDKYINNRTNLMSAMRPLFDALNYNGIAVNLTFKEDIRKTFFYYNNNTFWSPNRKMTFSCNQFIKGGLK